VGIEEQGHLVAAAIVVELNGPLIAEVAVHPAHRRRGYGRAVLRGSLEGLRQDGEAAPRLVVTAANSRARSLYESLGFQYVPLPEDNTWIDLTAAGRPDLVELLPQESS
jgi:ribosomal protein S18 acetylase RimI-like enzyme